MDIDKYNCDCLDVCGKCVCHIHPNRKPTTTDMVIHNTSNHPTQHKHAAFNHMLHRQTKIPLGEQGNNDELNTIKYIAIKN